MHDGSFAPGQDAPAGARPARADKTRDTVDQMSASEGAVALEAVPKGPAVRTKTRGARAKPTPKVGITKRSAVKAKKTKRPTGAKTGGGRKKAKPKKGGARRKTQTRTKTRAGTGKAGGKRNR